MDSITAFILDPKNQELLSLVKGVRNGLVYGTKVRFPHALVMTFLFKSGPLSEKIAFIFRATKQHATNLGKFVFIYKSITLLLKKIRQGKEGSIDAFLAGLIGGYYVFRNNNNVNNQIVLYLFSRILIGLAKHPVREGLIKASPHTFSVFAAVVWGIVMWQFRWEDDVLQPSLRSSMTYLYRDSDKWDSLRNFLWHNK
ncbi:hypothetical protein BZG36_00157 [Bifiguratus adelaidae]|uniref:Peroxisomal membrane protein 4 n=1 Tax=Bifiguratus adelaidae TaxID=1938954 RepID=A0A261Y8H3_9FUNG|nr:hypothetical protein BZG36_00157 [Bifiguratus adelaidae]